MIYDPGLFGFAAMLELICNLRPVWTGRISFLLRNYKGCGPYRISGPCRTDRHNLSSMWQHSEGVGEAAQWIEH